MFGFQVFRMSRVFRVFGETGCRVGLDKDWHGSLEVHG